MFLHSYAPYRRAIASPTSRNRAQDPLSYIILHQAAIPPVELPQRSCHTPRLHTQPAIMRFSSTLLLALPAIAVAEQQIPILDKVKGFFSKATAAVSSAIPAAPSNPINAATEKAASAAAQAIQYPLTLENWKETLTVDPTASPPTTQDWVIFTTGGNSTCFGLCANATKAWNVRCMRRRKLDLPTDNHDRLLCPSSLRRRMRPSSRTSTARRKTFSATAGPSARHLSTTSRFPSLWPISPPLPLLSATCP